MEISVNSWHYTYKTVNVEVTVEQLTEMVGSPVKTVPQIFMSNDGFTEYVGGFDELKKVFGMWKNLRKLFTLLNSLV